MRWGVVLAALLVATVVSGCSSKAPSKPADTIPQAFEDVQVSATTGAIRGIVVSEAVVPIANATVKLTALNKTKVTDAQGAFVFDGLDAGDYFLSVSKRGYFPVQASANVVAGVAEPPIVKVQLKVDANAQPYTELLTWNAYLACGAWAVAVTTNPCAVDGITCQFVQVCLLGSSNVQTFPFGGNRTPDFAQGEAVFEGTQPTGNWLDFSVNDPKASVPSSCKGVNSQSPAIFNMTPDEISDCEGEKATSLTFKIFPGATPGTPPTPTIVVQQRYSIFVTYFYGFTPRPGWSFFADGQCNSPDQCGSAS